MLTTGHDPPQRGDGEATAPPRRAARGGREIQRRHPAVVPRASIATWTRSPRSNERMASAPTSARGRATATASARRRRAARARAASAELLEHDLQVAQREAGDRDSGAAGRAARRRAGSPARGSSRPARRSPAPRASPSRGSERQPAPSSAANGSRTTKSTNGASIASRPAAARVGARGDRDGGEQRRVERVRPDEVAARDERDREHEQHRREHLALGGRAVQRRLDRRDDFLVRACSQGGSRGHPRAGAITVEK